MELIFKPYRVDQVFAASGFGWLNGSVYVVLQRPDRASADLGRLLFDVPRCQKHRVRRERVGSIPTVFIGRCGYGVANNHNGSGVSLPYLVRPSTPGMHLRGAIFSLRFTARSPVLESMPKTEDSVEFSGIEGLDFCSDIPDDIQILSTRDR